MQPNEKQAFQRMLGVGNGELPKELVVAYGKARFASDRIGSPPFVPRDLVMIALAAGVLPEKPKTRSEIEDEEWEQEEAKEGQTGDDEDNDPSSGEGVKEKAAATE